MEHDRAKESGVKWNIDITPLFSYFIKIVLFHHAKDWLQRILNGTIHTWKELEDKFLESITQMLNSWKES